MQPSMIPVFVLAFCQLYPVHGRVKAEGPIPAAAAFVPQTDTAYWSRYHVLPESFPVGYQTFIFGENTRVREAPSLESGTLALLPAGQLVEIIGHDTRTLTIEGRTAHWHCVRWEVGGRTKEGWVWGGLLAILSEETGDELFMLGCTRVNVTGSSEILPCYSLRLVRNRKLLASCSFKTPLLGAQRFAAYDSRGLSGIDHVAHFHSAAPYCPGLAYEHYFLWTAEGELQVLPVLQSIGEGGQAEAYWFPEDTRDNNGDMDYLLGRYEQRHPGQLPDELPDPKKPAIIYFRETAHEFNGWNDEGFGEMKSGRLRLVGGQWAKPSWATNR